MFLSLVLVVPAGKDRDAAGAFETELRIADTVIGRRASGNRRGNLHDRKDLIVLGECRWVLAADLGNSL